MNNCISAQTAIFFIVTIFIDSRQTIQCRDLRHAYDGLVLLPTKQTEWVQFPYGALPSLFLAGREKWKKVCKLLI